jgi:ribA/ribD-fused uncharacterized protein
MKGIKLKDLPLVLTEDVVIVLMKMAWEQTPEWVEIWESWSYEKKEEYSELKSKINSEKFKKELEYKKLHQTQEEWDKEQLGYWGMYVNRERHYTDYTIEDVIEMTLNKIFYTCDKLHEIFVECKTREKILKRQQTVTNEELFTFFWVTKSPFSQWHKSNFSASTFIYGDSETKGKALQNQFPLDVQEYSSAEQFMMYHKAMIFLDREVARQIMQTDDVRKIKDLGRRVKNYDEYVWQYFRSKVVYEGNKAKFTQNEDLKQALFSTQGTTLVEAAPNDRIWGIGLSEDDPRALKRETWLGKNLLGEILTQIRIELMGDY